MKKLFLILMGIIMLIGCSKEQNVVLPEPPSKVVSAANLATPVAQDSIEIALSNSMLLQDLEAYNQSVLAYAVEPQWSFRNWIKKVVKVVRADVYGFVGGFVLATAATESFIVGGAVGVITGTTCSVMAASGQFPNSDVKRVPAQSNVRFEVFDNCTFITKNDIEYRNAFNAQLNIVGDLTGFAPYVRYLSKGVDHNLVVDRYNSISDYSSLLDGESIINEDYIPVIYADQVMDYFGQDQLAVQTDNLNWEYVFSDRIGFTQTISQAKAAAMMKKFMELVTTTSVTGSSVSVKDATLNYMKLATATSELGSVEKQQVLYALPIYMYSLAYWNTHLPRE